MAAFMNHQVHVVKEKEACAVRGGINEEQEIEAQPADSRITRNRLPLSEILFQEVHSGKRNKYCGAPAQRFRPKVLKQFSRASQISYFRMAAKAS
jgi:hypothetical protein